MTETATFDADKNSWLASRKTEVSDDDFHLFFQKKHQLFQKKHQGFLKSLKLFLKSLQFCPEKLMLFVNKLVSDVVKLMSFKANHQLRRDWQQLF